MLINVQSRTLNRHLRAQRISVNHFPYAVNVVYSIGHRDWTCTSKRSNVVDVQLKISQQYPMIAFFLPMDRLNWTLPEGPSTCNPLGVIRRICARYPSVNLSPVTHPSYRYFRPSVWPPTDILSLQGGKHIWVFVSGDRNRSTYGHAAVNYSSGSSSSSKGVWNYVARPGCGSWRLIKLCLSITLIYVIWF